MPFGPGSLAPDVVPDDLIRVDEYQDGGSLVIRAEMPGIDPEEDVEVTVSGGMLHIHAERHEEENEDEKDTAVESCGTGRSPAAFRFPTACSSRM
jgi:HSP20 family protein